MEYNEGQLKALDSLAKWATLTPQTKEDFFFTLSGWSGTGKTTIIKTFLETLNISENQIGVSAPTHQAKKVIAEATGFEAETIQSLLGLRPDTNLDNFNPNKPVFNPLSKEKINEFAIIIIDEASMINSHAFNYIALLSFKYKVRIVYLGDAYQLAPVGEKVSKVFTTSKHTSALTQVMRQDDSNPMVRLIHLLRQDVMNGTEVGINTLLKLGTNKNGNKGLECLNKQQFTDIVFENYLSSEYQVSSNHIKFLAYTNDCVEGWAKHIRATVLGEASVNPLIVGEKLLGYNTISIDDTTIVNNGEEVIIITISEPYEDGRNILGYNATLSTERGLKNVFIVSPLDTVFKVVVADLIAKAKIDRRKWKNYFDFKNNYLLLYNTYYNDNKTILAKKDIHYASALTVHKSQGDTFDNVAFNLPNVLRNYKQDERSRLLYVGLSRLKYCNYIHI